MPSTLSSDDRKDFLIILDIVYQGKVDFSRQTQFFSDQTVLVVEELLQDLIECNAYLKSLVTDLVGGASYFAKGWLRKSLKTLSKK
jgi:hypothetical protein